MTWGQFISFFQFAIHKDTLHGGTEDKECTADGTQLIEQFEAWRKTQPALTWTKERPVKEGWYWYQEDGKNMDSPMPAWIFDASSIRYACRYGPHELLCFREPHRLDECPGQWCGPIEVPG